MDEQGSKEYKQGSKDDSDTVEVSPDSSPKKNSKGILCCFCRKNLEFWKGKQRLYIANTILKWFLRILLALLIGSFGLSLLGKLNEGSKILEIITIFIYGAFNIISLIVGFVAGASLDKDTNQ